MPKYLFRSNISWIGGRMVTLTMKEQLKLEVIQRVMDNQVDISKAAQILLGQIKLFYSKTLTIGRFFC